MKFDVIVGNPPYNSSHIVENGAAGRHTLWDKFVTQSFELLVDGGWLCYVHPAKWRQINNKLGKLLMSKNIIHIDIHDIRDGQKVFGVTTPYDWYVCQNADNLGITNIRCSDGSIVTMDIRELNFIPNSMFDEVYNLVAKFSEDQIGLLKPLTPYHMGKDHMSNTKDNEFIYPCIKYVSKVTGEKTIWWSSTNELGHFGIPKVIFGCGASTGKIIVDDKGEYGHCNFSVSFTGETIEDLYGMKKAFESEEFKIIMDACRVTRQEYNKNLIATFRKDFWKDFVDEV